MKRKLLFVAALAASALGFNANAQETGIYYIQNVGTGKWFGPGNSWGSQGSVLEHADFWKLAKKSEGVYTFESVVSNGGNSYYFNGSYCDGATTDFTITLIEDGVYSISNNAKYVAVNEGTTIVETNADDASSALAQWKLYSETDMQGVMNAATAESPADATYLIKDHNIGRHNRYTSSWTITNADGPKTNIDDGWNAIYSIEAYKKTFDVYQTLNDVPNGIYSVRVNAFYRQDGDDATYPYVYANDAKATFPVLTGTENNMQEAAVSFTAGKYLSDAAYVKVTDGTLKVGAATTGTTCWSIFKNFHLYYYGAEATVEDAQIADLKKELAALRAEAAELKDNDKVSPPTVQDLEQALAGSEEVASTIEELNAAIAPLKTSIAQAQDDIPNKTAIDAMYDLLDKTNVYTPDAYYVYKALADDYLAKFEARELTDAVANPSVTVGWNNVANPVKTLLLSAWDSKWVAGENSDYYINNWSTEGYTDGTNFTVPFFEYFVDTKTDAPVYLSEKTLTATMEGLEAGDYEVTAWVRSQVSTLKAEDAPNATGVTLVVNDGDAVDVTEGDAVTNFNIGEYTAKGTVGDDGKLTIKLIVASENNIHWLSFKNVKYTLVPETNAVVTDLTGEMFHEWDGLGADANITGNVPNIYFENSLGKSVAPGSTIYGNGNVAPLAYASLTEYDEMVVTYTTEGEGTTPRILFGQLVKDAKPYPENPTGFIEIKDKDSEFISNASEDGLTWTIDLNKVKELKDGLANLNAIKASGSDDPNITITITSVKLIKNETTYSLDVLAAGYASYITPAAVKFAEGEAYIVSAVNEGTKTIAQLVEIAEAPANTPVIIKGEEGTHKFAVVDEAKAITGNLLKIANGTEKGDNYYVLAQPEGQEVGFYALNDVAVPVRTVYLPYTATNTNGVKFIGFEGNDDATVINGVETPAVENGVYYNLAGQRVQAPTKGIYIVNGKKVLVK